MVKSNKVLFEILKDVALFQYERQNDAITSIEAKTGFLFAGIGVLMSLFITVIANKNPYIMNPPIFIGLLFVVLFLIFGVYILWGKSFQMSPYIETFYKKHHREKDDSIRLKVLAVMNKSLNYNRSKIIKKGRAFNIALSSFIIAFVLILYGIFINSQEKNDYKNRYGGNSRLPTDIGR